LITSLLFIVMATFLRRSSRFRSSNLHYQGYRSYFTGSRYSGYVNYFHNENLFGFVVREDAPEREYYFHVTDLHAENIPRVRPLQPVEFSIIEGRGGNFMARDISSLGGQPIRYAHANMKMPEEERNRNLSELPNAESERHTGVVVSIMPSGKGGLIVPDRLNFGAVGYSSTEIQATGAQRLERFAEVEFFARPSKHDRRDRAVCITRRGGGLITAERRNTGHSRRLLGAMYGPNDIQAQIPRDFQENRRRGYVVNYSRDKLYGFVVPFDSASHDGYFVHIDDCHIFGARFLRRFQEVEFSVVTDAATGKSKALHVSAPNKTVLRSVTENRYLPTNLTNTKLPVEPGTRYTGSVMVTSNAANWFIIKPDEKGFEPVIGYKNQVKALGYRRLHLDDALEFEVQEPAEQYEGGLLRATNLSAPSGWPILCELGPLGKYLQSKMSLSTYQNELPEYDLSAYTKGTMLTGFITNFSTQYKFGQIEIESMDQGTRYRRCNFKLDDCVMPSGDMDLDRIFIRDGIKVQFELEAIDYDTEFLETNRRKVIKPSSMVNADGEGGEAESDEEVEFVKVDPIVFIKAINVKSEGLDHLELTETPSFAPQIPTVSEDEYSPRRTSQFGSGQGSFQMDREEVSNKAEDFMNDDDALFDDEEEYK